MRDHDLILFDLDGTLVETAPEIQDAVNDTLHDLAWPEVTQQQVSDWIGHGTRELLIQALASCTGTSASTVRASDGLASIMSRFDAHYQRRCGTRSQLYPQVRETLSALHRQGVKLAVVTNKEGRYTRVVLDAHGLTPLLHAVVSGDSFPRKKPDPIGVHSCLRQFGVPPSRALFVGDSSIDVATARNAGVRIWALPYGYNMGQDLNACAPDRIIADCSVLLKI